MLRYALIVLAAVVLVFATLVPDDALARRGGGVVAFVVEAVGCAPEVFTEAGSVAAPFMLAVSTAADASQGALARATPSQVVPSLGAPVTPVVRSRGAPVTPVVLSRDTPDDIILGAV